MVHASRSCLSMDCVTEPAGVLTCRKPPAEPPWMEASPPGPGEEVLREKKLLKVPLPPLLKKPLQ